MYVKHSVIRASLIRLSKNIYYLLFLFTMTIMSAEEDTELRDLVAQTLESNGVLGKIRVSLMSLTCYCTDVLHCTVLICRAESSHKCGSNSLILLM